ncbi:flagellar hook-associated protein FlgK [Azospirillum sp. ST 5-10]|uniref:flagellar hook-associated protein FlgK n=1 Tax=unclassified Azospirillum TaxID=2630922 RepID=UPI003F49DD5B
MSLRIAGSIATSALRTNEVGLAVASSNVANVDTEGYTRKTATVAATNTGTGISGVDVTAIGSTVDAYLLKSLMAAQSDLGYAQTTADYLGRYQETLGGTESDTTLADAFDDLADSLATLATSPESESASAVAVQDLEELASELRSASATVQELRNQADDEIATTVDRINTNLETIDDLNDRIVKAKALGQDTSDLEDQRTLALQSLSTDIGISYQTESSGRVRVYTSSGTALVDSTVHELAYTPAATVSATTTFSAITIGGKDAGGAVSSGTLGALVTLRDETLPAQQAALDELATTLMDTLNGIHNAGTAVPAPQTLTGTRTVSGGDAFSATGTLRVAVTNADGEAVEVLDLDLSGYATVQEAVDAINGMGSLSASISADGKLVLQADDPANGVALVGTDDAVGADGEGFSAYFGLNDLLTGTGAADLRVADAIAADSARLATGTLSAAAGLAAGDTAVTSGDATTAQALSAALSASVAFDAAGGLAARTESFASYAGDIVQAAATAASKADAALEDQEAYAGAIASDIASQSGVNLNEELAAIEALQTAYDAAAAVMNAVQEMFDTALDMVG